MCSVKSHENTSSNSNHRSLFVNKDVTLTAGGEQKMLVQEEQQTKNRPDESVQLRNVILDHQCNQPVADLRSFLIKRLLLGAEVAVF